MRIIHIITSLDRGGAEEMLRRLLKSNDENVIKNTLIVTLVKDIHPEEEIKKFGYKIETLKISNIRSLILGVINLYSIIRKFKPNIVQTWLYHSDLIGGIVSRLALVPVVWNIRCEALNVERAGIKTMIIFNLCKFFSYFVPSKIICVGEKAKKSHIDAGFCKSKFKVIFNGFDSEKFYFSDLNRKKYRAEFHVGEEELLIGCVGRYHLDKGQDILIQAALEILKTVNKVKFIFIGRDCSYQNPKINDQITNAQLREKILMIGERRNISEILSSFDLYCMPSRSEGFPNSLAEAMLTEVPCIATNVGDTSNLGGGTIFLVEPNNIDTFVEKIKEFISLNEDERILMGKKAREQVVKNFSIEKARENFNSLYKESMR